MQNILLIVALIGWFASYPSSEALAQIAVNSACSPSGSVAIAPTNNILVCNSSGNYQSAVSLSSTSGTNGYVGIGTTSPQLLLDVNGAVRVGPDSAACSTTSSNAGEIIYSGGELQFCNGTQWMVLNSGNISTGCGTVTSGTCSTTSSSSPCYSSGATPGYTTITVQQNCTVVFKAWGGGGGGSGGTSGYGAGAQGGGGGYVTITLGPVSVGSTATYFLGLGRGGGGATGSAVGAGGTGQTGYNGGTGGVYTAFITSFGAAGGGGAASGVWLGTSSSGTLELIAAGGAGGSAINSNTHINWSGDPGGVAVATNTVTSPFTAGGSTSGNSYGGGGAGYPYGGAPSYTNFPSGGENYPYGMNGNGLLPGGYGDPNYPAGAGMGGLGGAAGTGTIGSSGTAGAVYWATY